MEQNSVKSNEHKDEKTEDLSQEPEEKGEGLSADVSATNPNQESSEETIKQEENVRPRNLSEFIGQDALRQNLRVFIDSAKQQGKNLDHTLFYGNPGLGKTTLAQIIAEEMGVHLTVTSGPVLEKSGDLAAILTKLEPNDLLFVDEIHRMPIAVEEILYPAMEDFRLDIIIGQGPGARTVAIQLNPFTLVGATTRMSLMSKPLRERFGIVEHLDFYSPEDLARIVKRTARILQIEIADEGALEIGRRSRGTPRIANRFLRRVRDFVLVRGKHVVSAEEASLALKQMGIDAFGLDFMDRKLLKLLLVDYEGGPVGVKTLAAASSEDVRSIEDIYEPYLIYSGFIKKTTRGRVATTKAEEQREAILSFAR